VNFLALALVQKCLLAIVVVFLLTHAVFTVVRWLVDIYQILSPGENHFLTGHLDDSLDDDDDDDGTLS